MWVREITKNNSTAYRYLERYTDPLTGKYKKQYQLHVTRIMYVAKRTLN